MNNALDPRPDPSATLGRAAPGQPVASDQSLRAGTYALLGTLLGAPPSGKLLTEIGAIDPPTRGDSRPLVTAWEGLRLAARATTPAQADVEYHDLFIGLGRGELLPHGSWYLTGFLMEQPLVALRRDLEALGIERREQTCEPEDHVAALSEAMSFIIASGDDEIPFPVQRKFFTDHLAPWIELFYRDLETARSARFYRAVGRLGGAFMQMERKYLSMLS
jgi:TorA maturation chaperone TorD